MLGRQCLHQAVVKGGGLERAPHVPGGQRAVRRKRSHQRFHLGGVFGLVQRALFACAPAGEVEMLGNAVAYTLISILTQRAAYSGSIFVREIVDGLHAAIAKSTDT